MFRTLMEIFLKNMPW